MTIIMALFICLIVHSYIVSGYTDLALCIPEIIIKFLLFIFLQKNKGNQKIEK